MSHEANSSLLAYLNHNKLCRPLSRASLQRPRLLRQLGSLSRSKLALLCAGAGYGKTTLILDFLRHWPHPVLWYRLDKTDRDVTQFVAYLVEGIGQHYPDFGAEIRGWIMEGAERDAFSALPHLLLHEVSKLASRPLLLVLDNFESVARSDEVCALVSDLLEYSGPEVHVVIASRTTPPLPIARLEARQEMVLLGPEELALTPEESRELLLGVNSTRVTDAQLDLLWRRTEGWAAGLVMIAEALQRGPAHQVLASLEDLQGPPDLVYRYFADEVFKEQSPQLQEFLLKTSVLKRLSRDIVNDLLEIDDGGELLAALEEGGSFAHTVEAGGADLRYHPLFRAFLLQKLKARHGDEHISRLYRRAGGAACRHQHWTDAVDLYAAVGDWQQVGEMVERVGSELAQRGFLDTVLHWLGLIPEEEVARGPMLLMLRGRLLRQTGRDEDALRDLHAALLRFQEANDQVGTMLAEVEITLARQTVGEYRRVEAVLGDALRRAGDDAALRSRMLVELSRNCTHSDELKKGARWGEMAVAETAGAPGAPAGKVSLARALRYYGRALALQGELQRGLEHLRRAVDLCRREDAGDLETGWSLAALGGGLTLHGAFDEARRVLDEAESLAHGCCPLLSCVWVWRGTVFRDTGAFDQAERDLERAGRDPRRVGRWARREMAFLRLRQSRLAEGLHLAGEALRMAAAGESAGEMAACRAVHGIALGAMGDRQTGLQQLGIAAETLRRHGYQQQWAGARWHLARSLLAEGRRQEALENLKDAVLWAAGRGLYHLWWWDGETVARLWPLAFEAGWASAYLSDLARLRLGPGESRFLYEALGKAEPALRAQLANTLRAVSRDARAHDVAADLLSSCHDRAVRRHVGEALSAGSLEPRDLARLRMEVGLTWKEVEVLVLYYLRPEAEAPDGRFRRGLAESLALSEETLKVHIRNLRRKMDLPDRRRGAGLAVGTITRRG